MFRAMLKSNSAKAQVNKECFLYYRVYMRIIGCSIYWDNGKENGNHYNVALYWGYIR